MKKKCEKYIRTQGLKFDTNVFSKLYERLIEYGYLVQISERKGCYVKDLNLLQQAMNDDNVVAYTTRCQKNIVTLQILRKIYQWHMAFKPKFKKF